MIRVLVVDDERDLREEVSAYIRALGCEVTEVGSIRQFHQYFSEDKFDLLIVDRLLPDGDGLDLVSELRAANVRCGVIMLTALDATKDRIQGLRTRADHYVTKPVKLEELGALISTLAWRVAAPDAWHLDESQWLLCDPVGVPIKLTTHEFEFLKILANSANKPVARAVVVEQLLKDPSQYDPRNLDALVLRLRKKVEKASAFKLPLKTVHGTGYVISKISQHE